MHSGEPGHRTTDGKIEEAIARWRAGDATAKNDLLTHAKNQVERMTRRVLRHDTRFGGVRRWEQTDDVAQGVFVRLSRTLDQFPIHSARHFFSLASQHIEWELKAVAAKLGAKKKALKHRKTNLRPSPHGGSPRVDPDLRGAEAREDAFLQMEQFLEGIAILSDEEREIIRLIFINGLTRVEAARVMELSLSTFNRRYRQARLKLGAELGGEAADAGDDRGTAP